MLKLYIFTIKRLILYYFFSTSVYLNVISIKCNNLDMFNMERDPIKHRLMLLGAIFVIINFMSVIFGNFLYF